MTEDDARDWTRDRFGAVVFDRLTAFADMVIEENGRQNLISPATVPTIWTRHIVDSLQLIHLAEDRGAAWLDIGSGGGFPGLVLAIAGAAPMTLVEPRRRRAEFLGSCIDSLALPHVTVAATKVEKVHATADVITARAVASVENLLRAARHCATDRTRWLLPRGSFDPAELPALLRPYRLVFHVEQSLTHPESMILVLDGARR